MIKKITFSSFALAALFIMISAINKQTSSGAPSASTGAPGEQTCGMSTCHDDNSLNSGTAKLTIDIGKMGSGKIGAYPIKIKITDAGKIRFGFQVTALDADNKRIGQFYISDSVRTQIIGDKVGLEDREYLTYTYFGTSVSKTGEAEWEAEWSPTENKPGKVTFYVAALSANNNGEDKGDHVYTTSATTAWETTLKTNNPTPESPISIALAKSNLTLINPQFSFIKNLSITDISGKLIFTKMLKTTEPCTQINLPELTPGVLIATIETSTGTITKKLYSSHD